MSRLQQFNNVLTSVGRSKVLFPVVLEAYLASFPEEKNHIERESNLIHLLVEMEKEGLLKLPSRRGSSWTVYARHSQPHWIQLVAQKQVDSPRKEVAWHPRMRWAAELKKRASIEDALKINEFFKQGGAKLPNIPVNERSLMIFGDEKRLRRLAPRGALLLGKMTLAELGCYEDHHPICYKMYDCSRTLRVLIVENVASYHSFCRWNQERNQYRCIVLGSGALLEDSHWSLEELGLNAEEYEYIGDLDSFGLRFPANINRAREGLGLPLLVPQAWLYQQMLALGQEQEQEPKQITNTWKENLCWLPVCIQDDVRMLLGAKKRIAQETIHLEWLSQFDDIKPPGGKIKQ